MKIPKTLGRYEIVDLVGHGGMGSLFRARDPRIGRFVAIKLLRPDFDTPEVRDRFSREARAAGSLSHPNIVTIYDVGEDNGLPFIAMEFVRGETFEDLAGLRPPLPIPRKIQLIEEVCLGLAHAHEQGIVHRDIKPANLILGSEGIVKILDFGIARLTASEMTIQGTILGTLNYMSPEQFIGTSVDARADIFAVGAVFYELLSHQQAFPGNRPAEVLERVVHGSPRPITDFCPDIDSRLVQVIARALEKDRENRFQDIAAMQGELLRIRMNPQTAERAPEPKRTPTVSSNPSANAGISSGPRRTTPRPTQENLTQLRARQIEAHLIAAGTAYDAGRYDAAIESCRHVLLLDDADERALSLLDRIQAALDNQPPAAASKPDFDDADIAPTIRGPNPILRELEERRAAAEQLNRTLDEFDQKLTENDLTTAGDLIRSAVSIAAADSRVQSARARFEQASAAAAAEARERQIRQQLSEAQAHLDSGNLSEAASVLKVVVGLAPEHPGVFELADRLRVATEQRAAAEAAERLQKQIRDLLQSASHRLVSESDQTSEQLAVALREVTEALSLDSTNSEALELKTAIEAATARQREEARCKTAISNARSRFAIGKHQAALRLLEDFEPTGRPDIVAVLIELRKALQQIEEERRLELERVEKQERVSALTAAARTALRKNQFDVALEHLAKASEADPTAPDIKTLTEEATAQRAAAQQREAKTEELLDDVERRITAGDLIGADDVLRMAARLSPSSARASTLKQRNEAAMTAQRDADARRQEAEKARAAAEEKVSPEVPVEAAITTNEPVDTEQRAKSKADELVAAASEMLNTVQQRPNDIIPAMQKIAAALELSPTHTVAQSLKIRADEIYNAQREEAFIRAAVGNARTRFAMGKHQAAFQLLEGLDQSANPSVRATLTELREASRRIEEQKALAPPPGPAEAPPESADSGATMVHGSSLADLGVEPQEPRPRWDLVVVATLVFLAVITLLVALGSLGA